MKGPIQPPKIFPKGLGIPLNMPRGCVYTLHSLISLIFVLTCKRRLKPSEMGYYEMTEGRSEVESKRNLSPSSPPDG